MSPRALQESPAVDGLTIALVTHEHDIAEYATRVVSFRDGRVVSDEPGRTPRLASDELRRLLPVN